MPNWCDNELTIEGPPEQIGFWIAFGLRERTFGLLLMQVGFTATSLLGIYRWFF